MVMGKIFVYRNLHKECYSLRQDGKVFAHQRYVHLVGGNFEAGFRVNKKGRDRVLREQQKNVHAFAFGLTSGGSENDAFFAYQNARLEGKLVAVTYNPYKAGYFYVKDTGQPVSWAKNIFLTPRGVWVEEPGC